MRLCQNNDLHGLASTLALTCIIGLPLSFFNNYSQFPIWEYAKILAEGIYKLFMAFFSVELADLYSTVETQ